MTNLGPDVTDMVLEQIDATGYFVDGEHKPFTVIEDVIKVAGGDDVPITIRSTEHGPLMSDVGETEQMIAEDAPAAAGPPTHGDEYGVAYRWTALEPGRTVESIIQLARMRNWDEFRAAAANWAVPAQNLAYADAEGNIGYQTPGSIPVRRGYSGKYPVPGWDSSYGWDGYIPFDALPNMLNPDSGLVVTANNAAIGEQYPYLLTDDWDYGYRAQRITDLLEQATAGSADASTALGCRPSNWTPTARWRLTWCRGCRPASRVSTSRQPRRSRSSRAGTSTPTRTPQPPPTSTRSGEPCRTRSTTTSSARTRGRTAATDGGT